MNFSALHKYIVDNFSDVITPEELEYFNKHPSEDQDCDECKRLDVNESVKVAEDTKQFLTKITKNSIVPPEVKAVKHDAGKPQLSLVPTSVLCSSVRRYTGGDDVIDLICLISMFAHKPSTRYDVPDYDVIDLMHSISEVIDLSERSARALAFGSLKYGRNNYKKGFKLTRLLDAALRHLMARARGEEKDPESGLDHLDHFCACVCMIVQNYEDGVLEDDR